MKNNRLLAMAAKLALFVLGFFCAVVIHYSLQRIMAGQEPFIYAFF